MKILLCIILFFVSSCQRTDYLYYKAKAAPRPQHYVKHILKDIKIAQALDILWIIDDSGSMMDYQLAVKNNMDTFMQEFTKKSLDWKMALITTDFSRKPVLGLDPSTPFTHATPSALLTFQNAISSLGINGNGTEMISYPIYDKLTKYPNFVRANSILAIMIVTDAEDQSSMFSYTLSKTLAFLQSLKPNPKDLVIYGALGAMDLGCSPTDGQWDYKGSPYEDAITITKGKHFPLCSNSFGKDLTDISKNLVSKVESPKIILKQRPYIETLKVFYKSSELLPGPKEENGYWYYNFEANAIVFHDLNFAKDELEEVEVFFEEAI